MKAALKRKSGDEKKRRTPEKCHKTLGTNPDVPSLGHVGSMLLIALLQYEDIHVAHQSKALFMMVASSNEQR